MIRYRLNGSVGYVEVAPDAVLPVRRVERTAATGRRRALGAVDHVRAADLLVGDRVGFAIDQERPGTAAAFVGQFGDPRVIAKGGKAQGRYAKSAHTATVDRIVDLRGYHAAPELWFLLGAYLGDGYRLRDRGQVAYCVGAEHGPLHIRIAGALYVLGLTSHVDRTGGATNVKVRTNAAHLFRLCGAFGDGAAVKRLPPELLHLEAGLARALFDGYMATDGSAQGRRTPKGGNELQARWKIASVSLPLLVDMQRLLLRLGEFASIHAAWPGGPQEIMGRVVNTKPRWELSCRLDPVKRTVYEFDSRGPMVWIRVREVQR